MKDIIKKLEDFVSDPQLILLEDSLNNFNILDVFGIGNAELPISSFLSWILDPSENHGLNTYFLRYFLIEVVKLTEDYTILDIDGLDLTDAKVFTEYTIVNKRIDILIKIESENFLCLIENKVDSNESEGQTIDYVKLTKRKFPNFQSLFVFITPNGIEAQSEDFIPIGYYTIKKLMEQVVNAKRDVLNEEVILLLEHFIGNLEVNILDEGKIQKLCIKIYEKHKEAIDKIISYKPEYMDIIHNELLSILDENWGTNSTKGLCFIFKKDWFEEFKEFYNTKNPFFNYVVYSYSQKDGIRFDVRFYIEKPKVEKIRDIFNQILDEQVKIHQPEIEYKSENKALKFKKEIKSGKKTNEDLKEIAYEMKRLIDKTIKPIETTVQILKRDYANDVKKLKE